MNTELIQKAINFAVKAHSSQMKKGTELPYIFHPMEAGAIASRITDDPEVICAAILHDVVEDANVKPDEIQHEFGERVSRLVVSESENKEKTWRERKSHTIEYLKDAPEDEKIVALCDKLSNVRALYSDLVRSGEALWQRFKVTDPAKQIWYYVGLLNSLNSLQDYPEYTEFRNFVSNLIRYQMTLPSGERVKKSRAVVVRNIWWNVMEDDALFEKGDVFIREFSDDGKWVDIHKDQGPGDAHLPIDGYRNEFDDFGED